MRAYQEMLYGLRRNDNATKDQWRRLLLQYWNWPQGNIDFVLISNDSGGDTP